MVNDVSMTVMTMFMSQQIIGISCVIKLRLLEEAQFSPAGRACDISPMHQNTKANISLTSTPGLNTTVITAFSHTTR